MNRTGRSGLLLQNFLFDFHISCFLFNNLTNKYKDELRRNNDMLELFKTH